MQNHILRANYVSMMWRNANKRTPNVNNPLNYGWKKDCGLLRPAWFEGRAIPEFKTISETYSVNDLEDDDVESGGEWAFFISPERQHRILF